MSDWQLPTTQETNKERQERVLAAKKKLKSFRAKQNALSSSQFSGPKSPPNLNLASLPLNSNRSSPTESPNPLQAMQTFAQIQLGMDQNQNHGHDRKESKSKHAHRRSRSTNKFTPAFFEPSQLQFSAPGSFPLAQSQSQIHSSKPSYGQHARKMSGKSFSANHLHKRSKNSSISISISKLHPQPRQNVFLQPKFNSSAESISSQASGKSAKSVKSAVSVTSNNGTGVLSPHWTFPRSAGTTTDRSQSEASPITPRGGHSHTRTASRHRRVGSVSNRSESLSIMGGIPVTSALLVNSHITPASSPALPFQRSHSPNGALESRLRFQGQNGAHGIRNSWGGERKSALAKLEGRMRNGGPANTSSPYGEEIIDLESCSDENMSMTSPAGLGGPRRNASWSHGAGQGSLGGVGLGLGIGGGEGARGLGMLVEEDEEEEEDGWNNHGRKGSKEHSRKTSAIKEREGRSPEGWKEKEKKKRPTTIYIAPDDSKNNTTATQSPPLSSTMLNGKASAGAKQFTFPFRNGSGPVSSSTTKFSFPPNNSLTDSPVRPASSQSHQSQDSHSTGTGSTNASIDVKKGLRSLTLSMSSNAIANDVMSSPKTPNGNRNSWMSGGMVRSGSLKSLASPAGVTADIFGRRGSLSRGNSFSIKKRSSISYKSSKDNVPNSASSFAFPSTPAMNGGGFGDLELDDEGSATGDEHDTERLRRELKKKEAEIESLKIEGGRVVRDAKSRYGELERKMAEEVEELHERIEELEGSLKRSREAMESGTQERVMEIEGLRKKLDSLQTRFADMEVEKEEYRAQAELWKIKAEENRDAFEKERSKVEEEKKENLVAREKIRKLGDRLTEGINAEVAAQSKLVNDMKDQVFSLMASLEKERKEHDETKKALENEREKRLFDELIGEMQEEDVDVPKDEELSPNASTVSPLVTRSNGQHTSTATMSSDFSKPSSIFSGASSRANSSVDAGMFSDDEFYKNSPNSTTFSAPAGMRNREAGSGEYPVPSMMLGGLQTLTEAEEEEEEEDGSSYTALPPLPPLDSTPVQVFNEDGEIGTWRVNSSNYVGSAPVTPAVASMPVFVAPTTIQIGKPPKHQRKESFVRAWSFPKGSTPMCESDEEEEDSFFNYNAAPLLPPLPISASLMSLPTGLSAGLDFQMPETPRTPATPAHYRRPSSPRPIPHNIPTPTTVANTKVPGTPRRQSGFFSTPPVARSAHVSASLSGSKDFGMIEAPLPSASSATSLAKRLSLQSFASLFGSYATMSPTATAIAASASKLCAGPTDRMSIDGRFQDVTQPLLNKTPTMTQSPRNSAILNMNRISRRYITPSEQPRPVPSRVGTLNFSGCCSGCCDQTKGLIIV